MSRRKIYIPEQVKEDIRNHLNIKYKVALDGYFSANEDEDTLTGDFGGTLRARNRKVEVTQDEIKGVWSWSLNYTKFRGRGINATENRVGADGIIELELNRGYRVEKKSILFQSKQNWVSDSKLIEQCVLLSTWREAAFVLNFEPDKYEAFELDFILNNKGKKPNEYESRSVDDFLGNEFLNCDIGDSDLLYDARRRLLKWRSQEGLVVGTKFSIPQRLALKIKAPIPGTETSYDKEISNNEIHNHRMDSRVDEILSLPKNYTMDQLNKSRKKMAALYHPDKYSHLSDLEQAILNRRMQEINMAFEELKNRKS
ncbi:J domain-containing protein [uncultured Psychroserpens sp.]|uniref:J domain-containing protein n=1 Tax=uncultured Psychroserpens sp. TaxID=255436 RepID=UPI0026155F88|nr:J domain-containing protein [uncultured Psychroserpens sp.]